MNDLLEALRHLRPPRAERAEDACASSCAPLRTMHARNIRRLESMRRKAQERGDSILMRDLTEVISSMRTQLVELPQESEQPALVATAMIETTAESLLEEALKQRMRRPEFAHIKVVRRWSAHDVFQLAHTEILHVLGDLISNALHAMALVPAPKHTLTLRTAYEAGTLQLEIKDTGAAIAPEHAGAISESGFMRREDGHGFGLCAAVRVAQHMGGSLRCYSQGAEGGARFVLSIPTIPVAQGLTEESWSREIVTRNIKSPIPHA